MTKRDILDVLSKISVDTAARLARRFVTPVSDVKRLCDEMYKNGSLQREFTGQATYYRITDKGRKEYTDGI